MLFKRTHTKKAIRLARLIVELDNVARERKRPSALPVARTTLLSR